MPQLFPQPHCCRPQMCDSSSDNSDDSTSDSDAGSVPRPARKPRATMAHLPDCNAQSDAAQTACGRARALSLSSFKPDTSWLEGPAPAVRQRLQAFMAQGLLGTLGIATLREASKGLGLPQPKRKEDLLVQLQAELGREDAGPSAPEVMSPASKPPPPSLVGCKQICSAASSPA